MIATCVTHCPWRPERVESMARLRTQLGTQRGRGPYREETERAPNAVWSELQWRWAAGTEARWCAFLQDDAMLAPNWWPALEAMLAAVPDRILGLESVHPATMTLARAGKRWCSTADGLIGVGYVLPRETLREFLTWRAGLLKGAVEAITEDTLLDVFALSTGRRIWHPIPTIIDHDTSLDSTYGNDAHGFRRPLVKWSDGDVCGWTSGDLERPEFWAPDGVTHLGRFYAGTHWLCKQWTRDWTAEKQAAAESDTCPEEFQKWL
jgi:hypothetical protein